MTIGIMTEIIIDITEVILTEGVEIITTRAGEKISKSPQAYSQRATVPRSTLVTKFIRVEDMGIEIMAIISELIMICTEIIA